MTALPSLATLQGLPNVEKWDNGLILIRDFITEQHEEEMINAFHNAQPELVQHGKCNSRKRVSQHFGYHFDYSTFGASESDYSPLPEYMKKILQQLPIREYAPDQFTMQYYPPGAGIPPHVDTHSMFEEAIYSLSLGSPVPMEFRQCDANDARKMRLPKRSLQESNADAEDPALSSPSVVTSANGKKHEATIHQIDLPPRSLLIMLGASRYGFTHGIRSRKTDVREGQVVARRERYSLTMRTARRGRAIGCHCDFPGVCDARIAEEREHQSNSGDEEN